MRCCEVRGGKVRRSKMRGTPKLWAAAATAVETATTATTVETAATAAVASRWRLRRKANRAQRKACCENPDSVFAHDFLQARLDGERCLA
jgi:hypothetical protein